MPELATDRNRHFCSFEGFKPFKKDGTPKKGVIFAEWQQSKDRTAIMAYGKNADAFWYYTDDKITLDEARKFLGNVQILSHAEYEKIYKAQLVKAAEKINKHIDAFWKDRNASEILSSDHPCSLDDMNIDLTGKSPIQFTESGFLKSPVSRIHGGEYKHLKIKRSWGEFDYYGTGAYIRGELTSYPKLAPSADFVRVAQERYGLKAISSPLAPLLPLTQKSGYSLFGWSVSGGVGCSDVAINLASGVVVPLDDQNDLSHHKHGWSYAHKYMGTHGNTGEMVIMRKHGEFDFGISDDLFTLIGGGDFEKGSAKVVRYLCALAVLAGWNSEDVVTLQGLRSGDQTQEIIPREVLLQC